MHPISFFFDRIGQDILRGTTIVRVTDQNYQKLYELQSEKYTFEAIIHDNEPLNVCLSCEG